MKTNKTLLNLFKDITAYECNWMSGRIIFKFDKAGIPLAAWGLLGFYRGTQYYKYQYNSKLKYYEEKMKRDPIIFSHLEKPEKYYSLQFGLGIWGTCVYIMPIIGLVPLLKEIYRLEINLRGLKDKQETDSYYNLLVW